MPNSDSPLRREEWSRGARRDLKQTAGVLVMASVGIWHLSMSPEVFTWMSFGSWISNASLFPLESNSLINAQGAPSS